jgi:membrane protease subunit (stomatin/prohibitin family)
MDEIPERFVRNRNPVGIPAEFCSRGAILKIILVIVFSHPGSFNKWIQEGIIGVFAETLPSITVIIKKKKLFPCANRIEVLPVYLNSIDRVGVAAPIVHVQPFVIIDKEIRVPSADLK